MTASICRQWADGCLGSPGSRRLRAQLDPTLNVMSSHTLVLRRRGVDLATRGDRASGQRGHGRPIGETVRGADAPAGGPVPAAEAPACGTTRHRSSRRLGRCHRSFAPADRPSGIKVT